MLLIKGLISKYKDDSQFASLFSCWLNTNRDHAGMEGPEPNYDTHNATCHTKNAPKKIDEVTQCFRRQSLGLKMAKNDSEMSHQCTF